MTDLLIGREERLTFKANLRHTRYGWLRLTPAYSLHLVRDLLDHLDSADEPVLDPYCGTGTTALACAEKGIPSMTTDINPFLIWLARAKTATYSRDDAEQFRSAAQTVSEAMTSTTDVPEWLPPIHQIEKWWDEETLHALGRGMAAVRAADTKVSIQAADLLRGAFCRTLIDRASVSFGHQSMSFKKRTAEVPLFGPKPLELVVEAWTAAVEAFVVSAGSPIAEPPRVELGDARDLRPVIEPRSVGCVITSPPYPNRMSYIRELRPYMYWLGFLGDAREAGELDWQAIGGTWGCATSNVGKWAPPRPREVPYDGFNAIIDSIAERSDLLSRYVHKYFYDMVDHLANLTELLSHGATLHYIVGNSKFYDTMLPVQDIYGAMFSTAGLEDVRVETIRKRSSKRELFEYLVSARMP